ncbi:hypothetical protein K523DRAFT_255049 [Schizophyllum commune Tattone D]|nr:hypothetical protein K523DRAFT_255049 [Schizophyllum commune Tattone D]
MFAPALALLSGLTLVSAAGLRYGATSQYGQNQGDWVLHQDGSGLVLGGSTGADLTISAHIQNGEVYIDCPANYKGYQAVLVPIADRDPAAYEVRFVNSFDNLPSGTQFGSWYLSDDRLGLANSNFTKVVNAFGDDKGSFHAEKRAEYDDLYTLEWVNKSYYDHGVYNGWFLVLDSANDVSC